MAAAGRHRGSYPRSHDVRGPLLRPSTRYPSRSIQAAFLLLRHRRLVKGPRIARPPAPGVDEREEIVGDRVEKRRLFVRDEMAGAGHDHQARGGAGALDEEIGVERALVLVADEREEGHLEPREPLLHGVERRPAELDAAQRVGMALRGMLGKALEKFPE